MFSTRQLMFGIATFIGGSSLFTVFVTQITHHDSYITALLAILFSLLVISVYILLIRRFPGFGLLEIHSLVYGKTAGRLLNALYTLFCIGFAAVSLRNIGDFFTGFIMPETPMLVTLILVSATCAVFAKKGIVIVLRNAFLFFVFMAAALLLNSLLLLPDMDFKNFLPVLTLGYEAYIQGAFVLSAAPLCEIIVFLILLPYADRHADVKKGLFWGLILGGAYLLCTFLRDIATLGIALSYLTEPTYEAIRLINLMNVFSRLEIVFAFTLIIMRVFKISVLFCAAIRAAEDTVGRPFRRRGLFLLFLSATVILAAMYLFRSGLTLPDWFRKTGSYLFAVFEMVLPLLTLFLSLLRQIKKKKV